jgi:hypothetical protein
MGLLKGGGREERDWGYATYFLHHLRSSQQIIVQLVVLCFEKRLGQITA